MRFKNQQMENNLLSVLPKWWQYDMTIETAKGPYTLSWEYAGELAFFTMFQIGSGNHGEPRIQTLYDYHQSLRQEEWDNIVAILNLDELPDDANILDVGSGVGINDLLLSMYLPNATFTLADQHEWSQLGTKTRDYMNGYNEEYIFYNCWDVFEDAVKTTGLNRERFTLIDPSDEWGEYDMILSTWSYSWHYPLDTYWQKTLQALKPGGYLMLDMARGEDVEFITQTLGNTPRSYKHRFIWRKDG